ncbi:MAG: GNAT family N-acetyltransferase [Microthrixaceae bacterium]
MTVTAVRLATDDDVPMLADLRRRWTEEWGAPAPASRDEQFAARFAEWFETETRHRTFWLAEHGTDAIGMVNLMRFTRMPAPGQDAGGWGYLGNMFVMAEHRNTGVGRQLLDALLTHADACGLARVVLSPTERSIPFYRRAGFDAANQLLLRPRP